MIEMNIPSPFHMIYVNLCHTISPEAMVCNATVLNGILNRNPNCFGNVSDKRNSVYFIQILEKAWRDSICSLMSQLAQSQNFPINPDASKIVNSYIIHYLINVKCCFGVIHGIIFFTSNQGSMG